jgi:hypothetical protein
MHLEGLAHKFTIGGTILAIILVIIALAELYHFNELVGESQKTTTSLILLLNKTDNLLTEMQKSTVGLDTLVNRTDQLIKIQSGTSSNISQQTIMKEYGDQTPFKVGISYCYYEEYDNDIAYSTIILDKNGDPTTLKFMLANLFRFYTLPTDNGTLAIGEIQSLGNDSNPELVEPTEEKMQKLPLLTILNQTKNSNDTYLFIRSEHNFAPYSEATGNLITKYTQDKIGQQMIEFKKNSSGYWELYPSQNSVCK